MKAALKYRNESTLERSGDLPDPAKHEKADVTADRLNDKPTLGSARYGYTFRRLLVVSDLTAIGLATAISVSVLELAGRVGFTGEELIVLASFVPVWLLFAHLVGLYHLAERKIDHTLADELGPTFVTSTAWIWLFVVAVAVVGPNAMELLGPGVLWVLVILIVLGLRAIARLIARSRSWFRQAIVLIGDVDGTQRVLRRIRRHPEWGLDPVAAIHIAAGGRASLDFLGGPNRFSEPLGLENGGAASPRDIATLVGELNVDRAVVTDAPHGLAERTELIRMLAERQFCVDYVSGEPETLFSSATLHHLEGLPILTVLPTGLWRGSAAIKRGIDLVLAGAFLAVLSPLLAYVTARIKLDSPGPVLFRQARVGKDGEKFEILKFRTMVANAEELRGEIRGLGIHGNGGMLKLRNDPRVTRFGAWLRRWSLDELPQLWNVLRGDMSMVGPRPLPLDEAPLVVEHFAARMRMRPGITGPWQTQGRSDIPFDDMVKLDYTYVVGWSLREDLLLMLKTVASVSGGGGAY